MQEFVTSTRVSCTVTVFVSVISVFLIDLFNDICPPVCMDFKNRYILFILVISMFKKNFLLLFVVNST